MGDSADGYQSLVYLDCYIQERGRPRPQKLKRWTKLFRELNVPVAPGRRGGRAWASADESSALQLKGILLRFRGSVRDMFRGMLPMNRRQHPQQQD